MILIVEDDPISRRALTLLLQARGYSSRAVASAEEALHVLHGHDGEQPQYWLPEMVLIDIDLPGMSGLQLLQCLQSEHPQLPCMLMSAHHKELLPGEGGDEADAHGRRSSARRTPIARRVPFLPKPLDMQKVLNVVRQHA